MELPLLFLSFIALMLLKCVLLHYTMKLANWYKNRKEKPNKKKYKDIYDYDFMYDYESGEEEEQDSKRNEIKSNMSESTDGEKEFQRESELQTAAKKLLSTIRERREKTAAALLNASQIAPDDTRGRSGYDPKEFLRASKYYEYLKDHLGKEKNWEEKKKS